MTKPTIPIMQGLSRSLAEDPAMDLSDVGNSIGIVLSKYLSKEPGWSLEDFQSGLRHGIELMDKRDPTPNKKKGKIRRCIAWALTIIISPFAMGDSKALEDFHRYVCRFLKIQDID